MPRGDLFPEIGPFETGYLPLSDGHVMYWEQVGNPAGKPVLFLHGGPGAGAGAVHRRFFDPAIWRVIIFDQRGAGRSRPLGSLENNNTPQLIEDIETLRKFMNVGRMLLFGGSWGSTLALAYAQAHPEHVAGAVLRGIFLGRAHEVEWFLYGLQRVFPDSHAAFASFLPPEERHDLLEGYFRRLTNPDPIIQAEAARVWSMYEGSCSTLLPSSEAVSAFAQDRAAIGLARIEAHYFRQGLFLPPGGLLAHMDQLQNIPGEIVQGRYDMICPAQSAFELAAVWGQARLTLVPDAGHSALEPGVRAALISALERCRSLL
ncbi:MAG: prolyl aminopeptidase [Rhodospirillales bacterium]|nr:prolyl aminopeptidase [Rhodospirillales bacterium]MDE2319687.1 prolyl aminopeptidase [Rhodospirillales bacterium]